MYHFFKKKNYNINYEMIYNKQTNSSIIPNSFSTDNLFFLEGQVMYRYINIIKHLELLIIL